MCIGDTASCTIWADLDWQTCADASGQPIAIQSGETLTMTATGTWTLVANNVQCGPAGCLLDGGALTPDDRYDETLPPGALLWQVGSDRAAFLSPGSVNSAVTGTGQVQFRINDKSNLSTGGENNDPGSMNVSVRVAGPP
jgi:hypothetical protein